MKIVKTIIKVVILITGLTLIVLDLLKLFPVEWQRLVMIGGVISAFSIPLYDVLSKFGFSKKDIEGKEKRTTTDNREGEHQDHDDSRNSRS